MDTRIVGPITVGPSGETQVLKLVQGNQTLGELTYYKSTRTVVHVSGRGPVRDLLVREAKARGLLHGKDIPDYLQHDQEHR